MQFGYDNGYLINITDADSNVSDYVSEIAYHDNGMYQHSLFEDYDDGGGGRLDVRISQGRDPAGMQRPGSIKLDTAVAGSGSFNTTVADFPLTYDGVGNVAKFNGEEYFYDPAGRLQAVKNSSNLIQDYDYDRFGNRVAVHTITNAGATLANELEPTSTATNRLLKTGYAFDAAGNATSRPGVSYAWDGLDILERQINGAAITHFLYTADDERIGTELPFEQGFTWRLRDLGGRVLSEFSSPNDTAQIFSDGFESGNTNAWSCSGNCPDPSRGGSITTELPSTRLRDLIHRGGNHEITVEPISGGERRLAFVRDYLGTTRIIYQSDAAPLSYYFLPFGRQEAPSPTGSDNESVTLRYTNHERDTGIETDVLDDLDYMRARYCSPIEGRFLTVDPIISADPREPMSWNRYTYGQNNPTTYLDPNGLEKLRFTLTTFIPAAEVTAMGRTFEGDDRGFRNRNDSFRTRQEFTVETEAVIAENPLLNSSSAAGMTRELNFDRSVKRTALASSVGNVSANRDGNGTAVIRVNTAARNPLTPPGAPAINNKLTIRATGTSITVAGTLDGFPAVQLTVQREDGASFDAIRFDPASVRNRITALLPIVGDQKIKVSCSLDGKCTP